MPYRKHVYERARTFPWGGGCSGWMGKTQDVQTLMFYLDLDTVAQPCFQFCPVTTHGIAAKKKKKIPAKHFLHRPLLKKRLCTIADRSL